MMGSNQLELGESDGFRLVADDSFSRRSNDLWRLVLATGLPWSYLRCEFIVLWLLGSERRDQYRSAQAGRRRWICYLKSTQRPSRRNNSLKSREPRASPPD